MGTAILDGLLSSLADEGKTRRTQRSQQLPTRFIACVDRPGSVEPLRKRISSMNGNTTAPVEVWLQRNVAAVEIAEIVLLACQPSQAGAILGDAGMAASLADKLLLSICVGLSAPTLQHLIYSSANSTTTAGHPGRCHIVHAMPNTASSVRQSATILSTADIPLPPEMEASAMWVFESVGTVTRVASSAMNAASVAAAATPAFFALALEGAVRGATAEGVDGEDAVRMIAQAMKGTAEMALKGLSPSKIKEMVTTPNGCTARGVEILEAGSVEETFSGAVRHAILRVFELGKQP
ncbi:MAG: delta 1-pyrroline-5-carboxylate reductase [Alectoria fallacina]|uniref:Delta 1-pyrroline-5-carboxylate reductase n=1 Tax=Alectoria fallacina TaxID=1903189 RepID=A0A8H3F3W8_9LECA|nr:MAG: delta 1-pyrroline-5-carboxylate reductase [Alectoria fallacina]